MTSVYKTPAVVLAGANNNDNNISLRDVYIFSDIQCNDGFESLIAIYNQWLLGERRSLII